MIDQTLLDQVVAASLPSDERTKLVEQRLPVERLGAELPRAGVERGEPLRPTGRFDRRQEDRRREVERRASAEHATHSRSSVVSQSPVEDNGVRSSRAGEVQRLGARMRAENGEPVRREEAVERPRPPLLIDADQDEWWP